MNLKQSIKMSNYSKNFDDAYQRVGDVTKDVDTSKDGWWKILLQKFILPVTVLALFVLVIF